MKIFVSIESRCNFFFFSAYRSRTLIYRSYLCRETDTTSSWKDVSVFNKHVRKWCRKLSEANVSEREREKRLQLRVRHIFSFFFFSLYSLKFSSKLLCCLCIRFYFCSQFYVLPKNFCLFSLQLPRGARLFEWWVKILKYRSKSFDKEFRQEMLKGSFLYEAHQSHSINILSHWNGNTRWLTLLRCRYSLYAIIDMFSNWLDEMCSLHFTKHFVHSLV